MKNLYIQKSKLEYLTKNLKSFKISKIVSPIYCAFMNFLLVVALDLQFDITVVLYVFLTIFTSIIFTFFPINAANKIKNIVIEIELIDDKLKIKTLSSEVVTVDKVLFSIQNYSALGKSYNSIAFNYNNHSYNIILDFFTKDQANYLIEKLSPNNKLG
jgi:hypothetical protein